jgi:hypothetical protein
MNRVGMLGTLPAAAVVKLATAKDRPITDWDLKNAVNVSCRTDPRGRQPHARTRSPTASARPRLAGAAGLPAAPGPPATVLDP